MGVREGLEDKFLLTRFFASVGKVDVVEAAGEMCFHITGNKSLAIPKLRRFGFRLQSVCHSAIILSQL